MSLDDFITKYEKNWQPTIDFFIPRCLNCGSADIIRRGKRLLKRGGENLQYSCKSCRRKFSYPRTIRSHFSDDIIDMILSGLADGLSAKSVSERILREKGIKITRQTIFNILEKCIKVLLKYEMAVLPTAKALKKSEHWLIDDAYMILSQPKSAFQTVYMGKEYSGFITNVQDGQTGYWLAAVVSYERDVRASLNALKLAIERAGSKPSFLKCDGFKPHIKAAEKLRITVQFRTKEEDKSFINKIEALHSFLRRHGLEKRRFKSIKSCQLIADLVRFHFNWMRLDRDGKPIANLVSLSCPGRTWMDLLSFASSYLRHQGLLDSKL
ncbi:MAG: DDE-type integrase/transposase/recombinase [Nitrososphaerota archaeon]